MNIQKLQLKLFDAFSDLKFQEENHVYTLNGKILPSVSQQLKNFYEPFDRSIAKYSAKKRGISEEEILKEWDDKRDKAASFGTKVHKFGEDYLLECKKPCNDAELAIIQWWMDRGGTYTTVATELPVYSQNGYAGTPDLIMVNERGKLIIGDYKTNEDLHKNYKNKTLQGPFSRILDTPLARYSIQLSLYQMCLEEKGFEVEDRVIIWLKESPINPKKLYQEYHVLNYGEKLQEFYKWQQLQST